MGETTKYTKYSKKRYAQHCQRGKSPRKTQNTRKKDCMWGGGEDLWGGSRGWGAEERWRGAGAPLPTNGDAALPAPLTAQQGAHHMPLRWPLSYRRRLPHSRRAWVSRCAPPHPYEWCRRGRCPPAPLTKSLPLLWHQGTRLHKSTAYKRRGHPEPRRCASAKAREIPHPTEGRRHPVST